MPRLDSSVARALVAERWSITISDARSVAKTSHPRQKFASNGERISAGAIDTLVDELRQSAAAFGYPLRVPSDAEARAWDAAATEITWRHLKDLVVAEAGRSDVWAFLTIVACPDLVLWRYPRAVGDALPPGLEARFLGGRRNLLKRFWQRGRALASVGADWSVLNQVREDDVVQVFERPSLAAVPKVAGMFLVRLASLVEDVSVRDIQKRLNRLLPTTALYLLSEAELEHLLSENVEASRKAIAGSQKKTR